MSVSPHKVQPVALFMFVYGCVALTFSVAIHGIVTLSGRPELVFREGSRPYLLALAVIHASAFAGSVKYFV